MDTPAACFLSSNQPKEMTRMKPVFPKASSDQARKFLSPMLMAVAFVGILAMPGMAMAQEATDRVEEFFGNLNSLLNIASIAVVTIAVIFAGYQIAFAHKRISDVAPVLIGGFLIGAAAQIARMLLGDNALDEGSAPVGMLINSLSMFHA
jgi:type IV secretion system protein VirB2